jgi:hypothetical protein
MGNITHLANHKELLDLQDKIYMSVYQARAVLLALSSDDNFETLHRDDISGCLHVILDKLEDIKKEVDVSF